MIAFTTFDDLKRFGAKLTVNEKAALKSRSSSRYNKDTFLSHSSKDEEYLPGVITLLENHGASVYCDLGDNRLPDNPSPETASILKNQIKESKKLIVFITKNSKDSKWVPWELGIGDSSLYTRNVALLPAATSSDDQIWAKQEYLGLYRHIIWGTMLNRPKPSWLVYDHHTNTAEPLRDWLN